MHILKLASGEDEDDVDLPSQQGAIAIRQKVMAFSKMQKMLTTLREESELLLKIKGMSPDGKIPRGLLLQGKGAIRNAHNDFSNARHLDSKNEMRPKK